MRPLAFLLKWFWLALAALLSGIGWIGLHSSKGAAYAHQRAAFWRDRARQADSRDQERG